ncbi:Aldehyde/histidinol dehydrogenase [Pestalotiopsis sp. NC0098]|nr:Aldehyde/histidinol dehydrogenase [Pestalotiopsis sp. NC0098]
MTDYKIPFDSYHNVINNELTSTAKTTHSLCPSNEEPLPEVPVSTQEDVNRAVAAAKAAFPAWKKLSQDERAAYLEKFGAAIEANKEELTVTLGKEVGKPPQAAGFEMFLVGALVQGTAALRLKDETVIDDEDRTAIVRHVPLGVGVGIVPWNFPLALGIGKLAPALMAGNTYIWKPSPFTPYASLKIAEIGAKVFPPGVFQALSGDESLGPQLTGHPDVAKVSFTGSVETGKRVMAACAGTLKRVTLELGGNDAAIVCDDVDIDAVVAKIGFLSFVHCGQICMNIKRIYVHENIYDKFLAALVALVKTFKQGDHEDPEAFFGPVQNKMQHDKLQAFYSQIGKQGWKTALGGEPGPKSGKGFYMPPTIIDNPSDDSTIVTDEPFGPIVPVLKWSGEDEVIRRANDTKLGLGGSVWSKDVPRAQRMAQQLEAGSIWVNTHFELAPNVPFGGHKESGMGMDWGIVGLQGWTNAQAYWTKHSGA